MPTSYPGALDTLTNPTPTTAEDAVGVEHDVQHGNANDAIEAIEAKIGVGAGTAASAAVGSVLTRQLDGTTTWTPPVPALAVDFSQPGAAQVGAGVRERPITRNLVLDRVALRAPLAPSLTPLELTLVRVAPDGTRSDLFAGAAALRPKLPAGSGRPAQVTVDMSQAGISRNLYADDGLTVDTLGVGTVSSPQVTSVGVAQTAAGNTTVNTPFQTVLPAGASPGDLLVMVVAMLGATSTALTASAGWTPVLTGGAANGLDSSTESIVLRAWTATYTAGMAAPTVTPSISNPLIAMIAAISDGAAVDASARGSDSTTAVPSATSPDVTATRVGLVLVPMLAKPTSAAQVQVTPDPGLTEAADETTSRGGTANNLGLALSWGTVGAGPVPGYTSTLADKTTGAAVSYLAYSAALVVGSAASSSGGDWAMVVEGHAA